MTKAVEPALGPPQVGAIVLPRSALGDLERAHVVVFVLRRRVILATLDETADETRWSLTEFRNRWVLAGPRAAEVAVAIAGSRITRDAYRLQRRNLLHALAQMPAQVPTADRVTIEIDVPQGLLDRLVAAVHARADAIGEPAPTREKTHRRLGDLLNDILDHGYPEVDVPYAALDTGRPADYAALACADAAIADGRLDADTVGIDPADLELFLDEREVLAPRAALAHGILIGVQLDTATTRRVPA